MPLPAIAAPGWQLVWADEFTGPAIDRTRWSLEVDCWGGGNNERQCYTDHPGNARIAGGALMITALHEHVTGPCAPPPASAQIRPRPARLSAASTRPLA